MQFDHSWSGIIGGSAYRAFDTDPLPRLCVRTRAFDAETAWWLSELARVVYRRDTALADTLDRVDLTERLRIDRDGIGCLVATGEVEDGAATVIAFRGCTDVRSWLAALGVAPVRWAGGLVHGGFARVARLLTRRLTRVLHDAPRPWLFAGHSSGGAVAVLAAAHLQPDLVYTFGAPRFADPDFAERLDELPVYRLVNQTDLVAALPAVPFPYRHVGTRHLIDGHGGLHHGASEREVAQEYRIVRHAFAQLLDPTRWPAPPEALAHHAPMNYSAWLERLATDRSPAAAMAA